MGVSLEVSSCQPTPTAATQVGEKSRLILITTNEVTEVVHLAESQVLAQTGVIKWLDWDLMGELVAPC